MASEEVEEQDQAFSSQPGPDDSGTIMSVAGASVSTGHRGKVNNAIFALLRDFGTPDADHYADEEMAKAYSFYPEVPGEQYRNPYLDIQREEFTRQGGPQAARIGRRLKMRDLNQSTFDPAHSTGVYLHLSRNVSRTSASRGHMSGASPAGRDAYLGQELSGPSSWNAGVAGPSDHSSTGHIVESSRSPSTPSFPRPARSCPNMSLAFHDRQETSSPRPPPSAPLHHEEDMNIQNPSPDFTIPVINIVRADTDSEDASKL